LILAVMNYNGMDIDTIKEAVIGIFIVALEVPTTVKFWRDEKIIINLFFVWLAMYRTDDYQQISFLLQHPGYETAVEKAKCIQDDIERLFAELVRADARRVVWSIRNRSYECGGAVARLMYLAYSLQEMLYLDGSPKRFQRKLLDYTGVALWQVTCKFTHSPTPPTPPPPYTLHASNIELPPIEWPDTNEQVIRLWSTKSDGVGKRSPFKGHQPAIIQNLLCLANNSSAVSESRQQARIVELFEESEEEGGAPLPKCIREGHKSPIYRQERMRLPLPKRHISRPGPGDTISARNSSRAQSTQPTLSSMHSVQRWQ
jgi:hypothetical protein